MSAEAFFGTCDDGLRVVEALRTWVRESASRNKTHITTLERGSSPWKHREWVLAEKVSLAVLRPVSPTRRSAVYKKVAVGFAARWNFGGNACWCTQ